MEHLLEIWKFNSKDHPCIYSHKNSTEKNSTEANQKVMGGTGGTLSIIQFGRGSMLNLLLFQENIQNIRIRSHGI